MEPLEELQENLLEYFADLDDKTFVAFVDSFVYGKGTDDDKISKIATKFLEDNKLVDVFCKYQMDLKEPAAFFRRTKMSEACMINNIKSSLLSLSHNRLRNYV